MSISTIKDSALSVVRKGSFQVQHYSPEILTAVGVVGLIGAGVLAARATLSLESTISKVENRLIELKNDEDADQKDVVVAYSRNVFDFVKLYGPSITLGAVSVVAILSAHGIQKKRNLGLLAAYKAVETAYSNYRARVIEEFGEEKDRDFQDGAYRETVVDEETGKKKKVVRYGDPADSEYIFTFGRENPNWQKNFPEQNVYFLTMNQNHANDRLRSRGFLLLNDVLDSLGFPQTTAGSVVGWTMDGPDGFVDFGIDKWANIYAGSIEDGTEGHIRLNFNVDGPVWDKIDKINKNH